jgi:hypothetical protein
MLDAECLETPLELLMKTAGRRIPLSIAAIFLLQAGTAIWWAASTEAETKFQQSRIGNLEQTSERAVDFQMQMNDRLARIEERMAAETQSLARIEKQLGTHR